MGYLRGGKVLTVNLTERKVTTETVESYADKFIGGKGINAKILFDSIEPDTRPFDEQNPLLFGVGPLVGTPFPGASRMDVMAKSPVTGALGDAGMGGYFGANLKLAGFDNVAIIGKADKPVYIHIRDEQVEIRDAASIWGHDTYETPEMIRQDLNDPEAAVISIGPAGEKLVVYASILSSTGNAAARTGMGAVMGSKRLKAIAVHGNKGLSVAHPQEFLIACQMLRQSIAQSKRYHTLHTYGLTTIHDREMRDVYEVMGATWKGSENIQEADFAAKHLHSRAGCFSCPVACFDSYNIPDIGSGIIKCSPYGDLTWDIKNPDLKVCLESFFMCQRYGLDARSLSNALAWLMELYERGIISEKDTDGIKMKWGSPEAIMSMTRKMSYREGIGDLLADGLPTAAKKLGGHAEDYLLIAKGSPSDMHVIPIKTRGIAVAVSPIGEDAQHQSWLDFFATIQYVRAQDEDSFQKAIEKYKERAEAEVGIREAPDPRVLTGKVALVRDAEERTAIFDISGVCTWLGYFTGLPVQTKDIANLMTLGLGTTVTVDDLARAALRMQHVERAFGARLGLTRDNDCISNAYYHRLKNHDKKASEISFTEDELEKMKDEYYQLMGWDLRTGLPTRSTLGKFDLSDVADRLGI